jgi:hypothetical protein
VRVAGQPAERGLIALDLPDGPSADAFALLRIVGERLTGGYSFAQNRFSRCQQHMPHRYPAGGETAEDLVTVVLPQQGHRRHQYAAQLGEQRRRRVHHEPPPDGQVLIVADLGQPLGRQQVPHARADQFGVEQCAVRDQVDQFACGSALARSERTVDPDDHGSPSSVAHSGLPATPCHANPVPEPVGRSAVPTVAGP